MNTVRHLPLSLRRSIALLALLALVVPALVAAQAGPPRVSPAATVSQTVGLSTVEISYSRPFARDREIWGELVPWGEVWRTGANEATTLTLSHDAKIQGKVLRAGLYGVFTIPSEKGWTVIFNSDAAQWGAFQYDSKLDVLRVEAKAEEAPHQEQFHIAIEPKDTESATVAVHWGTTRVPFTVSFDTSAIVVETAREQVAAATPAEGRMVWNWAQYFYQERTNLDEALEWVTGLANNAPMYWTLALKARILAATDQVDAAIDTASQAADMADTNSPGVGQDLTILQQQVDKWQNKA
ncbi:MAG: DUF2911 domain-containing protein [Acidobacteriota bacterium]